MRPDPALLALAVIAEEQPNFSTPLTLLVNGALLTGVLVSREEFFGSHQLGQSLMKALTKSSLEGGDGGDYGCLHLLRCRLTPINQGVGTDNVNFSGNASALRVNVSHVAGFWFGESTPSTAKSG